MKPSFNIDLMMFGAVIKRLRKAHGIDPGAEMSRKQFAESIGATLASVFNWEQGLHCISTIYAERIYKVYRCDILRSAEASEMANPNGGYKEICLVYSDFDSLSNKKGKN